MFRPAAILLSLLLITSCDRKSLSAVKGRAMLPSVAVEDIPAPSTTSVTLKRGENLKSIGTTVYGHEDFSGFLAAVNGIPNQERMTPGIVVKTPSLAAAFRDAGMDPQYQPVINALAKACTDYYAVEPAYLAARRASGVRAGKFQIPSNFQATFTACANTLDASIAILSAVKPPHTVPKLTISQFRQASEHLRTMATGAIDENGYDYFLVGRRLGQGFAYAMVWTKDQYR